ncbi:MAG: SDR family NAD(P)-dependent oxidoreductase, partial [Dehalococcoidia bacterium]
MTVDGFDLSGKAALVLGCSEVGSVAATALAEAGADVAVVAASQEGAEVMAAKRTARRLEEMGRRSLAQAIDATNSTAVQVMVRQVAKELGGLDVLVNCQDFYQPKPAHQLDDAQWLRAINLNLSSVFYACRAVLREMERRGRGKIVNVASAM